jgi:hypothetical protein
MSDAGPTRRAVLATGVAAVAAFVAGCGKADSRAAAGASGTATGAAATSAAATSAAAVSTPAAGVTTTATTAADASLAWASKVILAEQQLAATYKLVIKGHPTLKARLTPLLAAHNAHVTALKFTGAVVSAGSVPTTQAAALALLASTEQKASALAAKTCITCPSGGAALVGSIAAADASHVLVLQSIGA